MRKLYATLLALLTAFTLTACPRQGSGRNDCRNPYGKDGTIREDSYRENRWWLCVNGTWKPQSNPNAPKTPHHPIKADTRSDWRYNG